jgi:murein DD-endopeptidase MepM/ murein hydrolase activator NlpD
MEARPESGESPVAAAHIEREGWSLMAALRWHVSETAKDRLLKAVVIAAAVVGSAAIAAPMAQVSARAARAEVTAAAAHGPVLMTSLRGSQLGPMHLVWEGADVDGDGQADFANPTGQQPRGHDAYGEGEFGASRDGGVRRHEGVDFKAAAGQAVMAPISGYVSKIGFAYAGDNDLRFVEITNPALHYAARVFYINPSVAVGDAVAVGRAIGSMHTLQAKYPGGMTDHVHLEVIDTKGRRIDAGRMITARYEPASQVVSAD